MPAEQSPTLPMHGEQRDAAWDGDAFWAELRDWRRDFHAHPEFEFEEHRTNRLVAERLRSLVSPKLSSASAGRVWSRR